MNTSNLNTLIQRYEDNFEWINNKENDEIFKWRAVRCFQDVWFSETAEDMTFAEKFKAATKECSVLLDNGQVAPTNGIVKMAEQEPDEVERLFVDVLFADDQGDLQLRQDHVEEFLYGIEAVRERTFPSYWKYGQDRHCAFIIIKEMSKTGRRNCPQAGKWESKELRASQGRKNHSAVNPAPEKGIEKTDQAERRSCLAER